MYHFLTKYTENLYFYHTWHDMCEHELSTLIQKWSVLTSHLHTQHVVLLLCPFTIWQYVLIWVNITHVIVNFFTLDMDNVDSASDAAFASISSSISSNWNNSFWIFFTSPICCVSEFHLPICGQEWGTVIFASWWACGDVLGGISIDHNIANFAFSKVHFCTIFLSNFMAIFFHSLMSLLCKHVISWCLLTKSMILKSIVASFFTSVLYSCISTIITHCAVVMYCWF